MAANEAKKGGEPKDKKDKNKSEFGTPAQVIDVVKAMQDVEDQRASDRSKINVLFNGQRPYTGEEEKQYNIKINVNWQEGKRMMRQAYSQLNGAFIHPGNLFTCNLEDGPIDKRADWSMIVTKEIHKPLQRGRTGQRFNYTVRDRNASVALHGVGPLFFPKNFTPWPRYIPLEDLLIPTETYCSMTNCRYFAINLYLTVGELVEMTQGANVKGGWNQKMVKQAIESQKDLYSEGTPSTWRDQPEAMKQIFYENRGYTYSDAIPKIRTVMFYWQEMDAPNKWYRVMYLRENPGGKIDDINKKFLYDGSQEPFADDITQVLAIQYGDNNIVPPMKYHAVRGLGVDLYAPVETMNRLRCEFIQAVFEHLKMYFRIKDPEDRDRLKAQILQQYGYIMDGLQIVPQNERHIINPSLVEQAMADVGNIMQEQSSSYVQGSDLGDEKTMTAKEATMKMNSASASVSAMLGSMYVQEDFLYAEMFRRFLIKSPTDTEVKAFRQRVLKQGVPEKYLDASMWTVNAERIMGGGDKTVAQQEANWLLNIKNQFPPQSQQKILRWATSAVLNDPAKAEMLVPNAPTEDTAGVVAAENVFGSLMQGVQVVVRHGIDEQGYVSSLLKMLGAVIQRVSQTDNMGTPQQIAGFVSVVQNINQHLMVLANDPTQKSLVKMYGDALAQLTNLIKGFAQRQSQARLKQMKQGQGDQAGAAKVQTAVMMAKVKAQIQMAKAQETQRQKQIDFQLDQARQNMETLAEINREDIAAKHELSNRALEMALENIHAASRIENGGADN